MNGANSRRDPISALFDDGLIRNYEKGEMVAMSDEKHEDIYMVKSGYVKSYTIDQTGRYNLLMINGAEDIFPVHILFNKHESGVFYEAMTPVVVAKISRESFLRAISTQPKVSLAILRKTMSALRNYRDRLENLEIAQARLRVIYRLVYLARVFGLPSKGKHIIITVPVNYQDLADSLNMARETVNREVRQLVRQGLVMKRKNYMVLLDKKSLLSELNFISGQTIHVNGGSFVNS